MAICEYNPDECVVTVGKDGRHYHSASHIPLRDEYCPIYMPTRIVPFPRGGPEVRHWKDAPPPPPSDPANQMDVGGPRDRFGDWALIIIPLLAWLGLVCFLLCAGCHGTELRLGTGRTFNDFSASGGSYDDDDDRNSSNSSSFSFDQGDSTSAWIELGFQLTPQTVVLDQGSFLPPAIPATAPASTTPVAFPVIDLAHLQASIEDLVARLDDMEEETAGHISWTDIGVAGGTSGSGLGLLWLALLYRKRLARLAAGRTEE